MQKNLEKGYMCQVIQVNVNADGDADNIRRILIKH